MNPSEPMMFDLLNASYARLLGDGPLAMGHDADWLYHGAPFPVLAHNTDPDPLFIYANRAAQTLFGYDWDAFIGLPSRLSAAPADRAERARLFEEVARQGFSTAYSGTRVTKSGRRFRIEQAAIWQLRDEQGRLHGEAAKIGTWRDIVADIAE
ncbi:MEKHLA domain-containing protein [Sphingomonas sp. ASY06-1R]|jgi:PAS domain S-box-containing protein|uniref:MEKHLA domain-containing protein n=1 Tax=Sphingomonas sp. ASY06-1R TaxID=3445771 RepID=UPI003FA2248B